MKKLTITSLILICLFLNVFNPISAFAVTTFKEGIYKLSDFNVSSDIYYTIQNISSDSNVYVLIFDENQRQLQALRLLPNSQNYTVIKLEPKYRLVIIGNGEVLIA